MPISLDAANLRFDVESWTPRREVSPLVWLDETPFDEKEIIERIVDFDACLSVLEVNIYRMETGKVGIILEWELRERRDGE